MFYKLQDKKRTILVAEISANHQKNLNLLLKTITQAKLAGADAIKLQTYNANDMTLNLDEREFIIKNENFKSKSWNNRSMYSLYDEASLPEKFYPKIVKHCKKNKILLFSSVFSLEGLKFLKKFKFPAYKIASLEALHFPLIEEVIKTGKLIIISTGTCSDKEIQDIYNFLIKKKCKRFSLMHCVTDYPANTKDQNMRYLKKMIKKFNCPIGFSDHTIGNTSSIVATAFGARIIEKHFKLKDDKKNIDNLFSLNPIQFKNFVNDIKKTKESLGNGNKSISKSENFYKKFRRSIYSVENIKKGEIITREMIKIIRPGKGAEPKKYFNLIGKKAKKNYKKNYPIIL